MFICLFISPDERSISHESEGDFDNNQGFNVIIKETQDPNGSFLFMCFQFGKKKCVAVTF